MISAIVLAAGASARMGAPKALLRIGPETFLEGIVRKLRAANLTHITIVLGAGADEISRTIPHLSEFYLINHQWRQGQLSSIQCALRALDGDELEGIVLWPVDRPLVASSTLDALLTCFSSNPGRIIAPVFERKRGHPTLFSQRFIPELEAAPIDAGARAVLWNHPDEVIELQVSDIGVVTNIDTRSEYDRVSSIQRT